MQNPNSNYPNQGQVQYRLPGDQQPTPASQKPNVTYLPGPHAFQLPSQRSSPSYPNPSQLPQTNATASPAIHRRAIATPSSQTQNHQRQIPHLPPTVHKGHPERSPQSVAPPHQGYSNPSSSTPINHDPSPQTHPPRTPVVGEMVAAVLGPTHKLFADAWKETTTCVQIELQNVHNAYSDLLRYEKGITEQAIETCQQLKAELDAARTERARAEAGWNAAMYELARLQGDKGALKQAADNMADALRGATVQNEELKTRVDVLLGERGRLRAEWDLARVLRLKLQEENISLKEQLSRRGVDDEATRTNGLITIPHEQIQVETQSSPTNRDISTTDYGWLGESQVRDQASPSKTSTEGDELELQYPPPLSENTETNIVELSNPSFSPFTEVILIHASTDVGYGESKFAESGSTTGQLAPKKSPSVKGRSRSRSPGEEETDGGQPRPHKRPRTSFGGQGENTVDLGVSDVKMEYPDF